MHSTVFWDVISSYHEDFESRHNRLLKRFGDDIAVYSFSVALHEMEAGERLSPLWE